MNVILINIDGARVDRIEKFPNFSSVFSRGAYFPNMVTYAPYTIASLYAILSGMYGEDTGVDNYYGSGNFDPDKYRTLQEYLKDLGYYNHADVVNKIILPNQGFDEITLQEKYEDRFVERHGGILEELSRRKENFFAFFQYNFIHSSLVREVIQTYKDDFDDYYFGNREENIRRYDRYMKDADNYVKEIMTICKRLGIMENSLIVFFSDHGASIGDKPGERVYGVYCYDYTVRAFAFFHKPGLFPSMRVPKQVRTIDIAPTILDVLEIKENPKYKKMSGRSLLSFVRGEEDDDRIAYAETGGLGGPFPSPKKPNVKCIRTGRWKLIYNTTTREGEFYDLEKDPSESTNLAGKGIDEESKLWTLLEEHIQKARRKDIGSVIDSIEI